MEKGKKEKFDEIWLDFRPWFSLKKEIKQLKPKIHSITRLTWEKLDFQS